LYERIKRKGESGSMVREKFANAIYELNIKKLKKLI